MEYISNHFDILPTFSAINHSYNECNNIPLFFPQFDSFNLQFWFVIDCKVWDNRYCYANWIIKRCAKVKMQNTKAHLTEQTHKHSSNAFLEWNNRKSRANSCIPNKHTHIFNGYKYNSKEIENKILSSNEFHSFVSCRFIATILQICFIKK